MNNEFGRNLQNKILCLTLVFLALGMVMVYSTSAIVAQMDKSTENALFFVKKQLLWILLASAAMLGCMDLDLKKLRKYGYWVFWIAIIALVLVLIPGIGKKYNGARRWIRFAGIGGQPSDLMKLAIIVAVATYIDRNFHKLRHFYAGFIPIFSMIALACGLILLEPDFGTCCFIFAVAIVMLLVANINWKHLIPISVAALPFVLILAIFKFHHIKARISVFLNPDLDPLGKGYQVRQSLIALGAGGKFGVGLGGSQQKLFFLSEESTDFIFAVIGEELGFLGTFLIVVLFMSFLYYGFKVVKHAPDIFGSFIALGVTVAISLQAAFNMAVVTQTVPNKGISLPFISFGGSGLIYTMMAVGLLLNVAGRCKEVDNVTEQAIDKAQEDQAVTSKIKKDTILIAGGGTGGHLLPGVALAEEIVRLYPEMNVVFLVPGTQVDKAIMEKTDFTWHCNPMKSWPGSGRNLKSFTKSFVQGFVVTEKIFHEFHPKAVIGLGSYGSFSPGILAKLHRVPLVLLESNVTAGKVVRYLAKLSNAVYAPSPVNGISLNKMVNLGIPLRETLFTTASPRSDSRVNILVMGGSQGAACINDTVLEMLPCVENLKDQIRIIHLTGNRDFEKVQETYSQLNFVSEVYPFHYQIGELYQRCDLAICRAGGGTIAELTALGIPSILIPFAKAAHGHQEQNARRLEEKNAAKVILESQLNAELLSQEIQDLVINPNRLKDMKQAASQLGRPKAATEIANHLYYVIQRRGRNTLSLATVTSFFSSSKR